ncbi:BsuPI-related putative proteinase inhibitor [Natrialbaceae archaeon A-gly3]
MTLEGTLEATVSDHVALEFTVENVGDDPVDLWFPTACEADFAVLEAGEKRWRWSEGRLFAQVVTERRLEVGETVTYNGKWVEPRPGEYTAVASLRARDLECEVRTSFVV